ncbi:MAG: Rv3235 family protein [Actinomycetota bacterium]|nr:Rv3235 family protein [Actinomycetota bacterium]
MQVRLRPVPAYEPPLDDEPSPRLRLVTGDPLPFDPTATMLAVDRFDRLPTPRSILPDPRACAARLVVATMEVLSGRRPVQQLMPWTDEAVYAQLSRTVRARRRIGGPGTLRSLRISEPAPGVAEVCAVVGSAQRSRAVAARLEGADGRWRCTALQIG